MARKKTEWQDKNKSVVTFLPKSVIGFKINSAGPDSNQDMIQSSWHRKTLHSTHLEPIAGYFFLSLLFLY